MRKFLYVGAALFIMAVLYEVINPQPEMAVPDKLVPIDEPNFWIKQQTGTYKKEIIIIEWLDDPSEAWHNADECGDSDDPEIYNDVHED